MGTKSRTIWDRLENIPRVVLYGVLIAVIFLSILFSLTNIMNSIIIVLVIGFLILGNIGYIGNKLSRRK